MSAHNGTHGTGTTSRKPKLDPARWRPPAMPATVVATRPQNIRVYDVSGYGPEDVNLLADGQSVTGLADGRIIGIDPETGVESLIADTGGRPLGIEHYPDGGLIVCDAYKGLLHVDVASGAITTLETGFEGIAFVFCNNAAVTGEGTIYFTDSSTKFDFEHWRGDLIEHQPTGRLFRRTSGGELDVLADGLAFANGVALAADESFVVFAETASYSLRRCWLTGERQGTVEPFGSYLPGFPDNISTGDDQNIWVAIASPRDKALDLLLPRAAFLRKLVWSLPQRFQPQPKSLIQLQAFNTEGDLVYAIDGEHARFGKATGVRQHGHRVWLGSFEQETIAVIDYPAPR